MSLTKKQTETLESLKSGKFDGVTQRDITSAINRAFNNEVTDIQEPLIMGAVEWYLGNPTYKGKTVKEVNKIIQKKMTKTSASVNNVSAKDLRIQENEIFNKVVQKLDIDGDAEQKDAEDTSQAPPAQQSAAAAAAAAAEAVAERSGQRMAADASLDDAEDAEVEVEVVSDENSMSKLINKYIDTNSKFYKDNKKAINKVLGSITPKNIKDGSYLTKIAGLEFGEIELFQKVIKDVGLGFSEEDQKQFTKMMSRDKDVANSVNPDDALDLALKMLINPDQLGILIKTRGGQVADDIKDWYKKITGQPRTSDTEIDVMTKINKRRKDIDAEKKKKKDINDWFGIPEEEEKENEIIDGSDMNPFKPINGDNDDGIAAGGTAYNPNLPFADVTDLPEPDFNDMAAWEIVLPPDQGLGEASGFTDFMNVMKGIFSMGGIKVPTKNQNKQQYLDQLKKENPAAFEQYENAMTKYNKTIGKAGLTRDGLVDRELSKDYIENSKNLTKNLLQKAIESGKMDRDVAESLYDSWDIFNKVQSGDAELSYAQMEKLQQQLINTIPKDILRENSDLVNDYIDNNSEFIGAGWEGDSDLGNFDWLQDSLDSGQGGETDGFDPETGLPAEKKIAPRPQRRGAEPRYRYKAKWGNDDETFIRGAEEIEKRNLIIEVQRLREEIDTTNRLVQSQIMTEKMRFNNTFDLPLPQRPTVQPLPNSFKKEHRAIFSAGIIQNPMRPFRQNTRNESDFGQYQKWESTVPTTTARKELLTNPLIYPSIADMVTHGEPQFVDTPNQFNYIENMRFTRY